MIRTVLGEEKSLQLLVDKQRFITCPSNICVRHFHHKLASNHFFLCSCWKHQWLACQQSFPSQIWHHSYKSNMLHSPLSTKTCFVFIFYLDFFSNSGVANSAPIRLVDGPNHCAGRLEVLWKQQWGTVCDDSWDISDATVVCRQLDCGKPLSAPGSAHFGQGTGPIWLDDMKCNGTEVDLSACRTRTWGEHNCNHGEDASVVCSGNSCFHHSL